MTNPLRHTGDSANVAYYAEENGPVWAAVLRSASERRNGKIVAKRPDYHVTVYRAGVGEVARVRYTPKTRPRTERLPERTVTRLVREALAES